MEDAPRSCYVLEISVQPGAARLAELHAYTELAHIRAWLESLCDAGLAYHVLWYGATFGVWVIQEGVAETFVDVHPFLSARRGPEETAVPVTDDAAIAAMLRPQRDADGDEAGEDAEGFMEDYRVYEKVELRVDWDGLAALLPPLRPPLLAPGEHTPVRFAFEPADDTYLDEDGVDFGSDDRESGAPLDPPFEIPGMDAAGAGDEESPDDDDDP